MTKQETNAAKAEENFEKKVQKIRVEMDSISINESFSRMVVAAFIARVDPDLEQLDDVKTAVSEAVTNAIVHAYPYAPGKIILSAWLEEKLLTVSIEDQGVGIDDISLAMEPFYTTILDGTRSGMGFCMMEAFMDEVQILSTPQKGTTVTMKKDLGRKNIFSEDEDDPRLE